MNNLLTNHVRFYLCVQYCVYLINFFLSREPHTYMRDDDMGMDIDATGFTRTQRTVR
jgi:hypothetical protein